MKIAILIVMSFILVNCGSASNEDKPSEQIRRELASDSLSTDEKIMFDLINLHRKSKGFLELLIHDEGNVQSREHTNYMAFTRRGLTHKGFKKRVQRVRELEIRSVTRSGENIAYNSTIERAHKALLKSSGHRKNIEGDFTHIGLGVDTDENGRLYVTQLFFKIK